jgi:hypothetical protein
MSAMRSFIVLALLGAARAQGMQMSDEEEEMLEEMGIKGQVTARRTRL